MRNRVERLRIYLLVSAVFLVLVIAAFIGSTRYLKHRFLAELPAKLGANVIVDTSGVTYNHTVQGHITYTIHAAKEIEHTDGKVGLHDVWIKLYGRNQDRADLIRGDEWEWDKKNGVVRAIGLVHIDLQSSGAVNYAKDGKDGKAAGAEKAMDGQGSAPGAGTNAAGAKVLHVTTSDLIYMQNLGVAATGAPIEFESGAIVGHAVGADYNSDSGVLMLHSAVSMDGRSGGRPVHLDASAAELDDRDHQVQLTRARYSTPGRTAQADQATLHLRADQTLQRIQAQGNVTMQANGATVVSERADVALNAASRAQTALLTGGVKYSADQPLRQMRGEAQEANIAFDKQANPQPQHAVFRGAVHMVERTRATDAAREATPGPWSVRELTGATVDAALAPAGLGKSELRDVEATGNAHYTAVNNGSLAHAQGTATTDFSADDLKAHMLAGGDPKLPPQLDTIAGRGHTLLHQVGADGVVQTSAGDTLDAKMRRAAARGAIRRPQGGAQTGAGEQTVANAVLTGHVVLTRSGTAQRAGHAVAASGVKNANADDDTQRATAQRAVYDGDLDRATLTGSVQLTGQGSELWASQVALDRATGDAHAQGAVKVDYVQNAAAQAGGTKAGSTQAASTQAASTRSNTHSAAQGDIEPTHILADRADLVHATDVATFHGKPARLWRGGSQVQAPVIELARTQKRLVARSEDATGSSTPQVHTVLMNAGGGAGPAQSSTAAQANTAQPCASASAATNTAAGKPGVSPVAQQSAMRVTSGELVYSQIAGEADFTGGFRGETADGTIRANQGSAYMDAGSGAAAAFSPAGNLDHVVASGQVAIDGTGLRATGERLLYTAADQVFLLTGDAKGPPKAVDARGTTTTGAALRFHHGCGESGDTVEVLGALPGEPAQHGHTVSHVSDAKKEKAGK